MEKSYRYLPYFFIAFFVLVIYCFYQSYFGHFPDFQGVISPIGNVPITITSVTHFHATMLVLWMLMLIVQPILIIRKQIKWHRILGKTSYVLMGLMVISIILIVSQEQLREKNLPVFTANLFDPVVFVVFYGLAIYYRKQPAYHSRFMIMSVLPFINPALARLGIAGVPIQLGMWGLLFAVEFFNRKTYKPYLIGFSYYALNLGIVAYLALANQPLLDKIWHLFF
jgi:glucan phosphoethanolaminetransferase (alkaline phosphatase superfamily)